MAKRSGGILLDFLLLDRQSEVPLHRQFYGQVREAVLSGRIPPGTRLPSTRTLASELGLSRTTLRQSFEQLTDEGCLDGRVGRGSFVPYELAHDRLRKVMPRHGQPATHKDPLARLSHRGKKIVGAKVYGGTAARPFDPGLPALDLFPAALWARVAARRWRRLENATMGYGQAGGYPPLRQALAAYLTSTRGLQCDERQIIITAGILQSLTLLSQLLLDPNDFVWVESPGIISGHAVFRAAGARLVPVHCDSAGLSVAEGRRKRADAKLVYLCPSRHYPLGRTMPLHRRLELLAWSKDAGSWILENDYDSEFRYRGHPLPALQGLDGGGSVIYLGSFSKTLFPGLRVGYLVVPPELADPLAAAQQSVMPVPTPVQAIIADFIDGGHYSNHIRLMRQAYGQREAALAEAIGAQASGLLQPEPTNSGFHFLAHLADHIDGAAASAAAERAGLIAYDLSSYFLEPPSDSEATRSNALALGFACVAPERMPAAVAELVRSLHSTEN